MKLSTLGVLAPLVVVAACVGTVGDGGGSTGQGIPGDPGGPGVGGPTAAVTGPLTRIARLTHKQYDNTVADLLRYTPDTPPSLSFLADSSFAGYDNNADGLTASDVLVQQYQQSAEALAAGAVTKSLAKLVTCTPAGDGSACAKEFIQKFGRRAFRRPLEDAETAAYLAGFTKAAASYAGTNAFDNGVQFVIESMLQSPYFLYRAELGQTKAADGAIPLSDYEVASRTSYLLWNTMPDDSLAAAADAGQMHTFDQVRAQALRLLADPRARETIADFHSQWLQLSRYATNYLTKNPATYPGFSADTGATLQLEATQFVSSVVFDDKGGFSALMTAPYTFVNSDTAKIYGVQGTFTKDLQKVQLNPAQRAGYLTQVGFLASHAYADGDSPIHRGVFIQRQLLCNQIPPPPPGVNPTIPPPSATLKTTRDRVAAHTAGAPCNGCHTSIINPGGFAFEHYDGIGAWRDQDNGAPVDAAATIRMDGADVSFTDAVDFAHKLAASTQARRCFVTNWMRYAYAHQEATADTPVIDAFTTKLADPAYDVQSFILDLTQTRSFLFRPGDGS